MGWQARAKKKNGMSYGQPGYVRVCREPECYCWYVTAADLRLPDVPAHARQQVRDFLAPYLGNIHVKNGDCWRVAQQLMKTANNPRVGYVEGVWTNEQHYLCHQRQRNEEECGCEQYSDGRAGAPHAWNTVDGYLVDLSAELKLRNWTPEWVKYNEPLDVWKHESLKEYSLSEIQKYETDIREFDEFSITVLIYDQGKAADYGLPIPDGYDQLVEDGHEFSEDEVSEPAEQRLAARLPKIDKAA
jgi:hypothetical protein